VADSSSDETAAIAASCGATHSYFEAFGESYGLSRPGRIKRMISYCSLEKELFIGMILLAAGVLLGLKVMLSWWASGL
jgi:hypothetical protein